MKGGDHALEGIWSDGDMTRAVHVSAPAPLLPTEKAKPRRFPPREDRYRFEMSTEVSQLDTLNLSMSPKWLPRRYN